MTDTDARRRVSAVEDPEMAVTIGDLGMVRSVQVGDDGSVDVHLVTTYAGCPAQLFIERDVAAALTGHTVSVTWDPAPWSPDAVSDSGRAALAEVGIAVPDARSGDVECPYCGGDVEITSHAGSSLCRSLGYCASCRNPVDVLRRPGAPTTPVSVPVVVR